MHLNGMVFSHYPRTLVDSAVVLVMSSNLTRTRTDRYDAPPIAS